MSDVISHGWGRVARICEILTNQSLLGRAGDSAEAWTALVLRYQKAIRTHAMGLLLREMVPRDSQRAGELADQILDQVLDQLRQAVAKGWQSRRGRRFRDQLREWVHHAHWLVTRQREPADGDLNVALGEEILRRVMAAMEQLQRRRKGNLFYTVVRLREEAPDEKVEQFRQRLVKAVGHDLTLNAVSTALSRGYRKFGQLLLGEVSLQQHDTSRAALRQALLDLGLMNQALRSSYCRVYLELA
jgi:hypothetical protein